MNPPKMKIKIYYKDGSLPDRLSVVSYNFNTPGFLCIHETPDLIHYVSADLIKSVTTERVKEVLA